MSESPWIETFPSLAGIEGLVHGFILRREDIDVRTDRDEALARLEEHHVAQLAVLGVERSALATAQQVHGADLALVDEPGGVVRTCFPGVDGLLTATSGQYLGIYVADCGAVSVVDPVKKACALLHSGKKGTEQEITTRAIGQMREVYGSDPADLIVHLAPCIRPPAYEVDFAAEICRQAREAGVPEQQIHDCGTCTTSDLERYYSYRVEQGKTGRLFAVLGWKN